MKIIACVRSCEGQHDVSLQTNDNAHSIDIPPKAEGFGSSANGGELLFLALATCYCNDIYRESSRLGITVEHVEVEVEGDFGAVGEPAKNVTYKAKIKARGIEEEIRSLMFHTDKVAEIQNTLRMETAVILSGIEIIND